MQVNEKNLAHKQNVVAEITDKIKAAESTVVVEYRGLKVSDITDLRRQLREEGVDFKVYKNSLSQRAAVEAGFEELAEALKGPNAIAFSDDAIAPSRVLAKFAKKNKQLVLKTGIVEGKVVDIETIKELSELPNREGLLSMFVGMLQSPMRKFAYAIKQVSELAPEEVTETVEAAPEVVEEATPEVVEEATPEVVEEATPEVVEEAAPEVVEEVVEEVSDEVKESFEKMTVKELTDLLKTHGKLDEVTDKKKAGYVEVATKLWGTPANVPTIEETE